MCWQKQIITKLLFCLTLVTLSSCMKRNIAGEYSAIIYEYPLGTSHSSYKEEVTKMATDSNGVSHTVTYTVYKHVPPDRDRIDTGIRFYFYIDSKLNIIASYYKGLIATTYIGKGKLREDFLIVDFFYRETKESGIGGKAYDSLRYSPPLSLRFYRSKNLDNNCIEYRPSEQNVNGLDEYWSSYYSFKIQKE